MKPWTLLLLTACTPAPREQPAPATSTATPTSTSTPTSTATPNPTPNPGHVELVPFDGRGALDSFVMRELARAERDGRVLLLDVGASWCEPCRRFHEAARRGELDADFPTLRLIELDRDRDEAELVKTSCMSPLIPMFARPTPRGNCSEKMIYGARKDDAGIESITPRLRRLVEGPS